MGFLDNYENQKRIVYAILFVVVGYPILFPIGLPITISQYTRDFYDTVEELPEGSVVLFHYGGDAAAWNELESQVVAVTAHLMKEPLKVIYFSGWPMGAQFIDIAYDEVDTGDKVYGEDYINIGYIAGQQIGVAALANDLHSVVNVDYYGDSIEGTFLDDINTGADIALCIAFETGAVAAGTFLTQFQEPYGCQVLAGSSGIMFSLSLPYYQSGQYSGVLSSVRGGAEYEILTKNPGKGVVGTDVLTTSHLWLIASVLIGNILYFTRRGGAR